MTSMQILPLADFVFSNSSRNKAIRRLLELGLKAKGEIAMADEPFEVADSSLLTDADWAEINKLQRAYKDGGEKGLSKAMGELAKNDALRFVTVAAAFFPDMMREAIKD